MLDLPTFISISTPCRGVAQPGSASALGAEGRRFESVHPDQNGLRSEYLACKIKVMKNRGNVLEKMSPTHSVFFLWK